MRRLLLFSVAALTATYYKLLSGFLTDLTEDFRIDDSRNVTDKSSKSGSDDSIVLISCIFGQDAANKRYLRLFVESARGSGVDVVLLGDVEPPFLLPDNVKHVNVSWNSFCDRVQSNVLDGIDPTELRVAPRYKVIDFKPLIPTLFPEVTQHYQWWGHLDNDMVLGNLRHFLTPERLHAHDVICGITREYTWGPLTLYRNEPRINSLYRHALRPLADVFNNASVQGFDEWGGNGNRRKGQFYNSTMSGIVERMRHEVRWSGGLSVVWDAFCFQKQRKKKKKKVQIPCGECILDRSNGEQRLRQDCFGLEPCTEHVALCHFQATKNTVIEESLNGKLEELMGEGALRINFTNGVTALD